MNTRCLRTAFHPRALCLPTAMLPPAFSPVDAHHARQSAARVDRVCTTPSGTAICGGACKLGIRSVFPPLSTCWHAHMLATAASSPLDAVSWTRPGLALEHPAVALDSVRRDHTSRGANDSFCTATTSSASSAAAAIPPRGLQSQLKAHAAPRQAMITSRRPAANETFVVLGGATIGRDWRA